MYTAVAAWIFQLCLALAILWALRMIFPLIKKEHAVRSLTTDEYLAKMARVCNCSVYDLFHLAASTWRVSRQRVDADFKAYITDDLIPYYVTDLIRRHKGSLDQARDIPLFINFH